MATTGYIPERIVMVFSDSINVGEEDKPLRVVPAYPVDANNKKRLESADDWAERGNYRHGQAERKVKKMEYENRFENVRINDLEIRGEGGRAYKVIVGDDYYVDFREDELMWVIKTMGIQPGGVMNGDFQFAVVGSQTKLVPVGSDIWKEMKAAGERKAAKEIAPGEFKVGHRYMRKNEEEFVVVAEVQLPNYELPKRCNARWYTRSDDPVIMGNVGTKPIKQFLVCEDAYRDDSPKKLLGQGYVWAFKVVKKPVAIQDLGPVPASEMVTVADIKAVAATKAKPSYANDITKEYVNLRMMQEAAAAYVPDPAFASGAVLWTKS